MKNWLSKNYIQGLTVITLWGLIVVFSSIGMPDYTDKSVRQIKDRPVVALLLAD